MTTSHQPVDEIDDIIELTDIIEEGTLPAPHAASPEKAVDAKSLDDELDALLSNAAPWKYATTILPMTWTPCLPQIQTSHPQPLFPVTIFLLRTAHSLHLAQVWTCPSWTNFLMR